MSVYLQSILFSGFCCIYGTYVKSKIDITRNLFLQVPTMQQHRLVEQLSGTIELDRTAGTAFNIVVKEKE